MDRVFEGVASFSVEVVAAERKKEKVWLVAKPLSRSNQVTDETLAELIIIIIIHGRLHLHYSRK